MNPIEQFTNWFNAEASFSKARIPTACCLSTHGTDGFPNARFVSLKEVIDGNFIVTGPYNSRKGSEIETNYKVALTFWWTETERQVRVQGTASRIGPSLADKYFSERNRDSQIVSVVSEQGKELLDPQSLIKKYEELDSEFRETKIKRPENWGGYFISPVRIEFMEFKSTRFHLRTLCELQQGKWTSKQIQP